MFASEKPKRFYSRKKLNSKKSSDSILERPDLDYNDIEKKTRTTQEILDQNNFPSTSKRGHKFPANKEITQGNQRNNKNLVLSESNVALGFQKARLGEGKNELDEVTNNVAFHIFLYVGKDDDTWEPEDTLNCPDIIDKYKKKQATNLPKK
uniref:Chromo domain-containing protein n=1 Tax=Glossina morsitans morsitans TaxID=37546 RepID=A0A1B0FL38_GLOMM